MSADEDAALAALQGDSNETSETEPAREPEASPTEEAATEAQVETGDEAVRETVGGESDGVTESEEHGADDDGQDDDNPSEAEEPRQDSSDETTGAAQPLATMDDVRRMEVHKDWIKTLTPRIPKGVFIDDEGEMTITNDAVNSELGDMANMFSEADLRAGKMSIRCKFYIARTVYELAARTDMTPAQVIDELDLCNKTGRDFETVYSWCKALAELPDGCFHPNLTMSHYVIASRVTKPKGVKQMKKFNKKRIELLKEAAIDPDAMSARQVGRELKQVTAALDKKEPEALKRESIGVIHDRLIDNYRVYRVAEVNPEILENNGIEMSDLVNQIEADENELINRHKICEDAAQIVLHWTDNPTVDVTETGEEEDESNNENGSQEEGEAEEASQDSESVEETESSSGEEE